MKLGDNEYGWPHAIVAICGVLTMAGTMWNSCQTSRHDRAIQQQGNEIKSTVQHVEEAKAAANVAATTAEEAARAAENVSEVAVAASQVASNAVAENAQTKVFLNAQYSSQYVEKVQQANAPTKGEQ